MQDDLHTTCMQPLPTLPLHMSSVYSKTMAVSQSLVLGKRMQDSFLQGPMTRDLNSLGVELYPEYEGKAEDLLGPEFLGMIAVLV